MLCIARSMTMFMEPIGKPHVKTSDVFNGCMTKMITSSSLLRMSRLGPPCVSVDLQGLMMGILGLELDLTRDPHPIFCLYLGWITIPELNLTWPYFIKPNPTVLLEMLPLVLATQIRKMAVQVTFPVGSLHFRLLILLLLSWSRQRKGKTSFQITNLPAAVVMPKPYHFLCPQNWNPSFLSILHHLSNVFSTKAPNSCICSRTQPWFPILHWNHQDPNCTSFRSQQLLL